MKLYLECNMGASGDMLMAALYELLPDKRTFREKMEQLKLPGVTIEYTESEKCGINGTRIIVRVDGAEEKSEDARNETATVRCHNHARRFGSNEALDLIRKMDLPDDVRENAMNVYKMICEAEAKVHGVPVEKVHLHEMGSLDAIADIVGCCLIVSMLGVTEITASPVNVGSGAVHCEHGILPVPAPAAAELLIGVPVYSGRIEAELCTPTGAALLKSFVKRYGSMPPMTVTQIGYGMGTKDFEAANCLRAFLYEDETHDTESSEVVYEISCNLDDMTPEAVGAAFDVLLSSGALDVFITPIIMKKNRPGIKLSCLCADDSRDALTRMMLEHTSTLGVRISMYNRSTLTRSIKTVTTEYGDISIKCAKTSGTMKLKPEYDDVLAAAKQHGVPFQTVHDAALHKAQGETR